MESANRHFVDAYLNDRVHVRFHFRLEGFKHSSVNPTLHPQPYTPLHPDPETPTLL